MINQTNCGNHGFTDASFRDAWRLHGEDGHRRVKSLRVHIPQLIQDTDKRSVIDLNGLVVMGEINTAGEELALYVDV